MENPSNEEWKPIRKKKKKKHFSESPDWSYQSNLEKQRQSNKAASELCWPERQTGRYYAYIDAPQIMKNPRPDMGNTIGHTKVYNICRISH